MLSGGRFELGIGAGAHPYRDAIAGTAARTARPGRPASEAIAEEVVPVIRDRIEEGQ